MDNSAQNLLKEAADRLIQTAEHLGRVASMSRLSTTSAGTSLSATSSVVTSCTTTSRPAISAPPIASSAAAEHAALFGYRPPTAGNVRSRGNSTRGRAGGRGRSSSSVPYHLHQRGHWSRSFVCLAYSNQTHPPTPSERIELALNNLGEKRIEFPRQGNGTQVHEAIISTFPSLTSGYQLLRNSEGRGKELMKIPMPSTGFSVDYLRSVLGQAKGFLRPLQKDIVLVESSVSNSERNEGQESTHEMSTGPKVTCINCSGSFAMSAISDHHLICNGGSSTSRKEKRNEGIEQYCTPRIEVNSDTEDPVCYLQQLFPDAARNDLEQALEFCKGDTNQAAEFLLQVKETGNSEAEDDEELMHGVWDNNSTQSDNTTDMSSLSNIIERLSKQLTGPAIRVTVDEKAVLLDALPIYKSTKFDATSPLTVQFYNQPAVDVGGPKREFYTRLFGDIASTDGGLNLVVFEGPDGRLMPKYSTTIVYSGILTAVGKMIAHSIVQCGIGFPFLSPAAYWYIVTGDISKAVGYCNISDVRDIEVALVDGCSRGRCARIE